MTTLQAVRPEGGIVPPSLFQHLAAPPTDGDAAWRASLTPTAYHLPPQTTLRDAASRSWSYLVGAWQGWRAAQEREPHGAGSTSAALVRERWLLVLLQELGYGRLAPHPGGITVGEHAYPVSHLWQDVPIHLLGPGVDLDRRNPGVIGATRAPQAMVQELLNRSDDHLWAILSNGLRLRLLRDSTALAGSAYIEFDLEAIFDGELFADFLLLWQVCHESRFEPRASGNGDPTLAESWLEVWRAESVRSGARALDRLRGGVERALEHLGSGFLSHPANTGLRTALASGTLRAHDVHRHLLRLVYRLLFLFVTEDRDLLLDRGAPDVASRRYRDYLSTARLRRHARERAGSSTYGDLWQGQRLVLRALGDDGEASLGLPALGGLFDTDGTDPLLAAELSNHAFLEAIRDLAWIRQRGERLQPVDYRNLGAEELGGVYEALLELVPRVDVAAGTFTYQRLSGNERKTTGSYYTPPALVSALLDTALDPVIDEAVAGASDAAEAERRLLDLKVCDPACGSGHFLVAAARRIAQRLAAIRSGENEPTPNDVRHALRDVIGTCVYGVDLNPLAAELAKVSLWLEAMEPGKALGFLDTRIRVGNSLLGTTPALLAGGVPDGAFKPIEGDDKDVAREAAKRNRAERGKTTGLTASTRVTEWIGQDQLDLSTDAESWEALARERGSLLAQVDDVDAVRAQARRWRAYESSPSYVDKKLQADAWVAAFVWPYTRVMPEGSSVTTPLAPTSAVIRRLGSEPGAATLGRTRTLVESLAAQYRFFHWHIEFPEVFTRGTDALGPQGWTGGFDAVLGNPPWEHIELKEQEYFASRDPELASATGVTRKRLISALEGDDPGLWAEYMDSKRRLDATRKCAAESKLFPLTGRGRIKTDWVFSELSAALTAATGATGLIVPTGLATGDTTKEFFAELTKSRRVRSFYGFNHTSPYFGRVAMQFCLIAITGSSRPTSSTVFAMNLDTVEDLFQPERRYSLTRAEIELINPETKTLPLFQTRRDATLTIRAHSKLPTIATDLPGTQTSLRQGLFNVTSESGKFIRIGDLQLTESAQRAYAPVYEGKQYTHFDHRHRTYDTSAGWRQVTDCERADPDWRTSSLYWVPESDLQRRLEGRTVADQDWLLCWRETGRSDDERTWTPAIVPLAGIGNQSCVMFTTALDAAAIVGLGSTMALDYVARQKVPAANLNQFIVRQFPTLRAPSLETMGVNGLVDTVGDFVIPRVLELVCNDWATVGFGNDLDALDSPFIYLPERREKMILELNAFAFHVLGFESSEAAYALETFPIVKRKDIAAHGEYRTKRLILEIYDEMQHAIDTGTEYQTILDPPPGEGPRHPPKE